MNLIVIAKAPIPGRVKTRLCPPCTPQQAAEIAEAALADTLEAVREVPGVDPIVVLDGPRGSWLPAGMEVLPQRGRGLDERLAAAFCDVGAPSLLIGMDTPQITTRALTEACVLLACGRLDAVLGPAVDGGWWAIGLCRADQRVFDGVPMSTDRTVDAQRSRMHELALRFEELPTLRDVDVADDALAVAGLVLGSRFARSVAMSRIGTAPTELAR